MVSSASLVTGGNHQNEYGDIISSSSFDQSRSSSASPRFSANRRFASSAEPLSTIPSASFITGLHTSGLGTIDNLGLGESPSSRFKASGIFADVQDNDTISTASSPRSSHSLFAPGSRNTYVNGNQGKDTRGFATSTGTKTRSSSLAPGNSSESGGGGGNGGIGKRSSSFALPEPVGSGSPRDRERLYERGASSINTTNAFSSSFPTSNMWLNEQPASFSATGLLPSLSQSGVSSAPRTVLSRHLSLTGSSPKSSSTTASQNTDWPESFKSSNDVLPPDRREGRSRTRMIGAPAAGSVTHSAFQTSIDRAPIRNGDPLGPSLSITADRKSHIENGPPSGIALSNMSPFVRDLGQLPSLHTPKTANPVASTSVRVTYPYSASYTAATELFPHRGGRGGSIVPQRGRHEVTGHGPPASAFSTRDFSLGAVGSGRKRRESLWGDERALREGDEEGLGSDDEIDHEDYAPPTRSGATSRRHSVAAFTSASVLGMTSPPMRSQIGFHLPGDGLKMTSGIPNTSNNQAGHSLSHGPEHRHGRSASSNFAEDNKDSHTFFGNSLASGGASLSSRMDDEDLLATDLSNALQLNIEAQSGRQDRDHTHNQSYLNSPRPSGTTSQAISLPAQSSSHFPQEPAPASLFGSGNLHAAHGIGVGQGQGHSPSQRGRQAHISNSPPKNRPGRASSTSGDPYSPSASAARFLATAHHVQPPHFQPPSAAPKSQMQSQVHPHSHNYQEASLPSPTPNLWSPPGGHAFSQQSPHFRTGTLPPPDSISQFSPLPPGGGLPSIQNNHSTEQQHGIAATTAPFSQLQQNFNPSAQSFGYNHSTSDHSREPLSPAMNTLPPQMQQHIQIPRSSGIPPFAGFGGMTAYHHHGDPTQTISHLNAHAQPYYVAPIAPQPSLNDLGRGVPLHALPSGGVGFLRHAYVT